MGWADAPAVDTPKWQAAPTYGTASQSEAARKVLEKLKAEGKLSPAEAATLDQLQAAAPANTAEIGKTGAMYRGFAGGVTLNARDNIADMFGGNGDAIRAKDAAAQAAYPDEFSTGNIAGGVTSAVLPGLTLAKIAKGLGPIGKALSYATAGGINGGASGFMDETGGGAGFTGPDLTNRLNNAKMPAAVGAGIGLVTPALAAGGGALARLVANRAQSIDGIGARAISRLRPALADTAAASGDVAAYLRSLGPEGMLADVPGPMQNQAMGLATMQGRGGAELSRAVTARAVDAGPRITQTMDAGITGPNAAFDMQRQLAAERSSVLGPAYDAALKYPDLLPVGGVNKALDPYSVGDVRASAESIKKDLLTGVPTSGPASPIAAPAPLLHNIRSGLSGRIEEKLTAGNKQFAAQAMPQLNALDSVLDTVPGYKDARTGYGDNMAMQRAIEDGRAALQGGRATASSPEEFRAEFDKLSTAQKDAFRTGMRRDIAALMGTAKNDAAAAWGEFAKTWNEEKLRIVLGADAEPILNRLKAEKVFSETRGRIDAGSMTAKRGAAAKSLEDANPEFTGNQAGIIPGAMNMANKYVLDPIAFGPRRSRLNADMGKALAKSGPDAENLVQQMLLQNARSDSRKYPQVLEMLLRNALLGTAGGAAAQQ